MDLEAPADAWYVWFGVAIVSFALFGIVLALPGGPPPDANEATNAIDKAAGAPYDRTVTYQHDADMYRIDEVGQQLHLKNEHGTSQSSISYDRIYIALPYEDLFGNVYNDMIEFTMGQTSPEEASFEYCHSPPCVPGVTTQDKSLNSWMDSSEPDHAYPAIHDEKWDDEDTWRKTRGDTMTVRAVEHNGDQYIFVFI